MITSFSDQATEDIYNGNSTKAARRFPQTIWAVAARKLDMIDAASELRDLGVPPANKLEKLVGDLAGFYSIRINDQYRIIFHFDKGQASDVQIVDYH